MNLNFDNDDHGDNSNVANFIRDVEVSAKKIIRDGIRNRKSKSKGSTYKQVLAPLSKQGEGTSKVEDRDYRSGYSRDEYVTLNGNSLYLKLKESPFYESWEQWNRTKQHNKDLFANSLDAGIYDMKKGMTTSSALSCNEKRCKKCNESDRYDMKIHLQSSALRKRYRCDQTLEMQEDENETGKKSQLQVVENQHKKEETTINTHPLYDSLFRHVGTVTARIKRMTQKRLLSRDQIKNVHSCWVINKEGLSRTIKRNFKNYDSNRFKKIHVEVLLGNKSQIQSVPLNWAAQLFNTNKSKKEDYSRKNVNHRHNSKSYPTHHEVEKNILKHIPVKLTPECWPLIIHENISYGQYKISISTMKERHTERTDCQSQEYWIVDVFGKSYKLLRRFVLLRSEVESINSSLPIKQFEFPLHKRKCVHLQEIDRETMDLKLLGECRVWVYIAKDARTIAAAFQFSFENGESRYGITCTAPIEVQCHVSEIMIRLRKHFICKAFDYEFWFSENNGKMIWEPLINQMNFDVVDSKTKKGKQDQVAEINWANENNVDKDIVQWIQPAAVDSHHFLSSLKMANDLFFRLDTIFTSKDTIEMNQLGGFHWMQRSRSDMVSKVESEMISLPPQSLRLLGNISLSKKLIPGACTIGQKGLWYSTTENSDYYKRFIPHYETNSLKDPTQAVAYFDLGYSKKGFPSVQVMTLVALESVVSAPLFHEWNPTQITAMVNKGEIIDEKIPTTMAKGDVIMKDALDSTIDKWLPPPVVTYDQPSTLNDKRWDLENKAFVNESKGVFQANGFRLQCQAHQMHYDSKILRQVYGISQKAATPNQTNVNCRSRWFSKEVCNYLLSNERGPEDFFHLLQNKYTDKDGGFANQPLLTTIFMTAYRTKCIKGMKMDVYKQESEKRKNAKEVEKKKRNLCKKISAANDILTKRLHDELHSESNQDVMNYSANINSDWDMKQREGLLRDDINESKEARTEDDELPYSSHEKKLSPSSSPSVKISSSNEVSNESINTRTSATTFLSGYRWRKLPTSILGSDFFELNKHKIQTCVKGDLFDKCNIARTIGRVNASSSIQYKVDDKLFETETEIKLVKDILLDRTQQSQSLEERQFGKEKILSSNQQEALDYILNVPLTESSKPGRKTNNIVEESSIVQENKERFIIENSNFMKQKRNRETEDSKVIVCVKHANYDALKEMIDDNGINVDTYDEFGNTLFILACQQGNKKMCKFLLRRGAHINAQNHTGNTGLHYLYEYNHVDLAEYLLQKGADDSFLNADGLTCYEGVSRDNLEAL